jgi:hypothetical protein
MAQTMNKHEAYDLIDQMPVEQIPAAISLLQCMLR